MKELAYLDRPYEKLESYGARILSDSELLAIILKSGTKDKPILEITKELMSKDVENEGITFLSQYSLEELKKINGIGRVKAIQLKAICELAIRVASKKPMLKEKIKTPEQLSLVFMGELRYQKQEIVKTAILDTQNRIIKTVTNSIGGLNSNSIEIREILRQLCQWKGIEIIEGEVCPDHIHILVSIPPKMSVSGFMGYLKGKSSLMIFQRWGNMKFAYRNREFWCKGYYVDTVGKNTKAIKEYIEKQLKKDKESDQLSIFDPRDPFMGSK